jgi:predicted PurR-regulated permease PerM
LNFGKFVGGVLFIIALYIFWKIRTVLLLALAAIFFATVINRLVQQLQKLKLKRSIAVVIALVSVFVVVAGIFAIAIPSLTQQVPQIIDRIPDAIEQLQSVYQWLRNFLPGQLLKDIESLESAIAQFAPSPSSGRIFNIFSSTLNFFLNLLLVIVVIIMMVSSPQSYRRVALLLLPSFYRRRADEVWTDTEQALVGWFVGVLFNMTVITVFSGLGLWLLGIPLPLTNAIIAGILTFIPNLGPTLSVIPPAALGLLEAPWKAGAVVILYIAIQQIESNILTPLVMKKQVSLLPAITLLSQVAFAVFFGLLGLFLALPIVVVAQVWLREILVKDILNQWGKPVTSDQ